MGAAKSLDKEINQYLSLLNDRQKKAVLTVVKTFAEEGDMHDQWKDENFIAALDSRKAEYEDGRAKLYTLEELEAAAIKSYKAKTTKK